MSDERMRRAVLPMTAEIPPGTTARVTGRPTSAFRPERILISEGSFPIPWARRAWTWPLVHLGRGLHRAHRGLARLLRVDLIAPRERWLPVSKAFALAHPDEVSWSPGYEWREKNRCLHDVDEDVDRSEENGDNGEGSEGEENEEKGEDGHWYVIVPVPFKRRERLLGSIDRLARRLSGVRTRWQRAQLATLMICDIQVSRRSQIMGGGGPLPAELFSTSAVDNFLQLETCDGEGEIAIEVMNAGTRACQLRMGVVGMQILDSSSGARGPGSGDTDPTPGSLVVASGALGAAS